MFFLDVTGFDCGGEEVLKVIKFACQLLDVILFIVPMALIVMVTVDFFKNVIAKEDDMKKNLNLAIKRILYCMALFLINPVVSTAIGLLGNNGVDTMACITIAKTEDLSQYKIDNTYNDNVPTPDFSKPSGVTPSTEKDNSDSDGSSEQGGSSQNTSNYDYKNIFIGDSRCVGMKGAISSDKANSAEWICEVGKGYSWLNSTALKQLDDKISANEHYNIIINLGINDLNSISNYINLYNDMVSNQKYKNSKIIVVSVNPVNNKEAVNNGYQVTNDQVKKFNKELKKNLKNGISYCNIYSSIKKTYKTTDGIHYDNDTSKKIYDLIIQKCL